MNTAASLGLQGTLLFHLNLNYSSIEVGSRPAVVRRCYGPLLDLVERRPWLRIAIEASGHTLERIARIDAEWIARLVRLMAEGRVEFVGSGDSQIIGPLVPAVVNRWNQALGRATYERLLGTAPEIALVNEMAFSQGLVGAYLDAGYRGLVVDWNNPRRFHPEWKDEWRYRAAWTRSPCGRRIALLWSDSVHFQRFQRAVAGELEASDYRQFVLERAGEGARHVFLYASDAEVFDFRPGRYASEPAAPAVGTSEWERIGELAQGLHEAGLAFTTPARVLHAPGLAPEATVELGVAANPVPVKKNPKYNVTRWALSGRDDVGLNARCFARARELERRGGSAREWQLLCRAWGSDLRTHLTEKRWRRLQRALPPRVPAAPVAPAMPARSELRTADVQRDGQRLRIETDGVRASLLARRGLALESLTLRTAGEQPLVGTLFLGHFEPIEYCADFYSGHAVLEIPPHARVTDLEPVEPVVEREPDRIVVRADVTTPLGPLPKEIVFHSGHVELCYHFSRWGERPAGSLRAGILTLLAEAWGPELAVSCANGGPRERFPLSQACDHGRSVSPLVSASAAFGATDGWIALDDGRIGLEASWTQEEAAVLPLLTFQQVGDKRFVRLSFSLSELDETHRPGAPLYDFRLSLRPYRNRR